MWSNPPRPCFYHRAIAAHNERKLNMKQEIRTKNVCDENGNPTGGSAVGTGIRIFWQNGPLGRGDERKEPNGAFVEGVIQAAIQRLEFFQESKFACYENVNAISRLREALEDLEARTANRESRKVEGTHEE